MTALLPLIVAALAGGLVVYIYFATRPAPYESPRVIYPLGARVEHVAGAGRSVLLAAGALLACLIFLAGSLSTLLLQ